MDLIILIGLVGGLSFISGWAARKLFVYIKNSRKEAKNHTELFALSDETNGLRIAIVVILLLISVISLLMYVISKNEHWPELWVELFAALFALSGAGLIGQIVFESILRRQLLEQTSKVLTSIILTDKTI